MVWIAIPVEPLKFLRKRSPAVYRRLVNRGQCLDDAIRDEARRLGFVACGFTRADAADAAGLELKRWLEAGHHGTMGWMEERAHHRVSPLALWPEARSAIALGMSYAPATDPLALAERPGRGRIPGYP